MNAWCAIETGRFIPEMGQCVSRHAIVASVKHGSRENRPFRYSAYLTSLFYGDIHIVIVVANTIILVTYSSLYSITGRLGKYRIKGFKKPVLTKIYITVYTVETNH